MLDFAPLVREDAQHVDARLEAAVRLFPAMDMDVRGIVLAGAAPFPSVHQLVVETAARPIVPFLLAKPRAALLEDRIVEAEQRGCSHSEAGRRPPPS